MDLGLELVLGDSRNKNNEDESNLNISDVIEVIQTTDPGMFSGGGEINGTPGSSGSGGQRGSSTGSNGANRRGAFVKILEQPASKALRFRYECEGRSAGSIPGASSTPENKTFPAIQVVGYKGRAVVVVSCVTKDPPYRPHPHNLVGREGCRRGVCTLEVSPETMAVTFSNLGIQCVKKKDIEEALRVREEIRVDPFRTGFAHRNQPTSIDLNAVRLCFQVFLEGDSRGKFTVPLNPIVSDPIYDKKAMSDLVICKLSDCSCTVAGGKEIILLCEKVAKEDIQVRFYEESNGNIVWESLGDFQPTHVHKQVAISFRTPRYRSLEVPEPVKVFIQLRRPSDGATSESLPFEFLPLDSGRPAFWSLRRSLHKKGDHNMFNSILAAAAAATAATANTNTNPSNINNNSSSIININNKPLKKSLVKLHNGVINTQPVIDEIEILDTGETELNDQLNGNVTVTNNNNSNNNVNNKDWCDYSEVEKITANNDKDTINNNNNNNNNNNEEKSLNDLLNQVAELDEIYSDSRNRLLDITESLENDETLTLTDHHQPMDIEHVIQYDDSNTYTSLQLAFKNPIEIDQLSAAQNIITVHGPIIEIAPPPLPPLKRENNDDTIEKLPPLPPKRIRKSAESQPQIVRANSQNSIQQESVTIQTRSNSFTSILTRPKSQEMIAPSKKLPPTPSSTLPNPKKKNFFTKLFGKKDKKFDAKSETVSLNEQQQQQQQQQKQQQQLESATTGGSLGNLSTTNTDNASVIRVSLHETTGVLDSPIVTGNFKFNGSLKDVDMLNLDLTEAEHYALYTAMAPHATQSEFDEMSCYYSPVEAGKILNNNQAGSKLIKTNTST